VAGLLLLAGIGGVSAISDNDSLEEQGLDVGLIIMTLTLIPAVFCSIRGARPDASGEQ